MLKYSKNEWRINHGRRQIRQTAWDLDIYWIGDLLSNSFFTITEAATTLMEFFGINQSQLLETPNEILEKMYKCDEVIELHQLGYHIPIINRKEVSM